MFNWTWRVIADSWISCKCLFYPLFSYIDDFTSWEFDLHDMEQGNSIISAWLRPWDLGGLNLPLISCLLVFFFLFSLQWSVQVTCGKLLRHIKTSSTSHCNWIGIYLLSIFWKYVVAEDCKTYLVPSVSWAWQSCFRITFELHGLSCNAELTFLPCHLW